MLCPMTARERGGQDGPSGSPEASPQATLAPGEGRAPATERDGAPAPSPSTPTPSPDEVSLIVGVGGSAGSLTPLLELFRALPPDSGMAFVVVSHQAATGQSLLPEILARTTAMAVTEIEGRTRVEPDHLYLVPRGYSVTLQDAELVVEPDGDSSRDPLPIDAFFRSLAHDRGPDAVGILLSGTGSDGTLGLAAIRAASGLCLVQDPETAEFGGMPNSAIAAQAADFALPIEGIPSRLLAYARVLRAARGGGEPSAASSADLERILELIRVCGGHDFTTYKRDTLMRRIERRMGIHCIEHLGDYVRYLENNEGEIDALWRDWLIGVSSFFRDPEAFQALAESLPPLLAARSADHQLRVWVPGCATGEEAYSIAIVVLEALEELGERFDVEVFATDLDPSAIETARTGRYPKTIADAVGARRLARFFVEEEHTYRVEKELRERIVFAVQDVLHDPPFTRVDLISCRNLLIYVVPNAQQALLSSFHYSLNPGGLLLLGSSEHVGAAMELFTTLDKRWRLFRRNERIASVPSFRATPWTVPSSTAATNPLPQTQRPKADLAETLRTRLAQRFGPPSVVVDFRGQIQQTHGHVGTYLELPPGRANLNVVDMARQGLRAPLASALREVTRSGSASVEKEVRLEVDGRAHALRLTVERIESRSLPSPLLLVSFQAIPGRRLAGRGRRLFSRGRPQKAQLEEELQRLREDLQGNVVELQVANEELASAAEEAQSANEELQSSNEELQTSKEETQSLNEELQTVNAQLEEKLRRLERANNDLLNLMGNLEIAIIFLDEQLRVKRFTPQARSVARLIDSDIGRPLADLATLIDYPDLLIDAERVLAELHPIEKQASAPDGVWYTVRIRPYRTDRNAVEGLVVTFIDITATKRAERGQAARVLAEGIVDAVHEPLLVLEPSLAVVRANRSLYQVFGVEPTEIEGRPLAELESPPWSIPRLEALLERTMREGAAFEGFEAAFEFSGGGRRHVVLSGRPVTMPGEERPVLIVLGIEDAGPEPAALEEDAQA